MNFDNNLSQERQRFIDFPQKNVISVERRNARERRRIKHVNSAFDELRKCVPCGNQYRKISKVETLRSAIEYIKALETIVNNRKKTNTSPDIVQANNDVISPQLVKNIGNKEFASKISNEFFGQCFELPNPTSMITPSCISQTTETDSRNKNYEKLTDFIDQDFYSKQPSRSDQQLQDKSFDISDFM